MYVYLPPSLLQLPYREEQLRAQGLDPSQFRDSNSFEEGALHLDLECGIPSETTATASHGQTTEEGSRTTVDARVGGVGVAGGGCDVGDKDKDKDTPSSTPLPPSLGVPIVTHSKGSKEGTHLYCAVSQHISAL